MAAKKKKTKDDASRQHYSDFPIKSLRQVSLAAGAITFVISFIRSQDWVSAVFHSFVVLILFSVVGGVIMITIVSVMGRLQSQKAEEMKKQLEQEQQEFFESQLRYQEEMDKMKKPDSESEAGKPAS